MDRPGKENLLPADDLSRRNDRPNSEGLSPDDWAGPRVSITLQPKSPVHEMVVVGWRPLEAAVGTVRVAIGDKVVESEIKGGVFEVKLKPAKQLAGEFRLTIDVDAPGNGLPTGVDPRALAFRMIELRALHSGMSRWL